MSSSDRSANPLAVGFVILIGAACALGSIILVTLLIIWRHRVHQRRNGYQPLGLDKNARTGRPQSLPFTAARRSSRKLRIPTFTFKFPRIRRTGTNQSGTVAQPSPRNSNRIASSAARSSIRSFESFYTDSSSWGGGSRRGSLLSRRPSTQSSLSSWEDLRSSNSSAEDVDARGAAARLKAIYGMEMQPVSSSPLARPANNVSAQQALGRIEEEERAAEWI